MTDNIIRLDDYRKDYTNLNIQVSTSPEGHVMLIIAESVGEDEEVDAVVVRLYPDKAMALAEYLAEIAQSLMD